EPAAREVEDVEADADAGDLRVEQQLEPRGRDRALQRPRRELTGEERAVERLPVPGDQLLGAVLAGPHRDREAGQQPAAVRQDGRDERGLADRARADDADPVHHLPVFHRVSSPRSASAAARARVALSTAAKRALASSMPGYTPGQMSSR